MAASPFSSLSRPLSLQLPEEAYSSIVTNRWCPGEVGIDGARKGDVFFGAVVRNIKVSESETARSPVDRHKNNEQHNLGDEIKKLDHWPRNIE